MSMINNRPLEGIRIIDLTQAYSGPFCTMHLADHGAEVIKVESPAGDQCRTWGPFKNGSSAYFAYINRNKKGIVLGQDNYLPVDKRGNVNVLVVGRFRFW